MSTLVAQTISNGTVSTSTANVINGAKAWVRFTSNSNAVILASYNVSSITYNTTGSYTVNMTNALTDANYSVALSGFGTSAGRGTGFSTFCNSSVAYQAPTSSSFIFQSAIMPNAAATDANYCSVAVFR